MALLKQLNPIPELFYFITKEYGKDMERPVFKHKIADENERCPMALILGNELAGVDPGLLSLCDAALSLPMTGQKASLNVAVAFGVAAYWLMFA